MTTNVQTGLPDDRVIATLTSNIRTRLNRTLGRKSVERAFCELLVSNAYPPHEPRREGGQPNGKLSEKWSQKNKTGILLNPVYSQALVHGPDSRPILEVFPFRVPSRGLPEE